MYLQAATKVILVSDHCPLQWLRKQKDPRGKYARWLSELESIPYTIVNRRGRIMEVQIILAESIAHTIRV